MRVRFWFATVLVAGAGCTGVQAALQTSDQDPAQPMVEALAQFRFDELGHPQIQSDSIKPVLAPIERPHKLLILPVRFVDKGYDRFAGDPAQDDKNRAYFQDLLFTGGPADPEPGTLSHYYWHQSRGRYNITGDIFGSPKVRVGHCANRTRGGRSRMLVQQSMIIPMSADAEWKP